MKRWTALLLACLAIALVFAACGDDDDDGGGDGDAVNTERPADEGSAGEGGGAEAGGATVEVAMKDIQFEPNKVGVQAGDKIVFTNEESVPHDVKKTSGPGADFSSGAVGGMQEGDTFELRLDQPGTYKYECRVHAPGMSGTITVR